MKYVVIDTCIILHILRNNATGQSVINWLQAQVPEPTNIISVVTKAELESLKVQNNWGQSRCHALDNFLSTTVCIDINQSDKDLLRHYVAIDAYSKGKAPDDNGRMKLGSAIKMGKNDLWIAATASVLNVLLLTADGDFDHLNGVYLNIVKF